MIRESSLLVRALLPSQGRGLRGVDVVSKIFGASNKDGSMGSNKGRFRSRTRHVTTRDTCPIINIRIVVKTWPTVSYLHIHPFLILKFSVGR